MFCYKVNGGTSTFKCIEKYETLSREEEVKYHEMIELPKSFHVSAFIHKFENMEED